MPEATSGLLLCLQSGPGLLEGQTEGNRQLRVKLGRLLCQLGKLGLITPGDMYILSEPHFIDYPSIDAARSARCVTPLSWARLPASVCSLLRGKACSLSGLL